MDRVPVADAGLHPQRAVRLDHIDIDNLAVVKDAEIDGLVEDPSELRHLGLRQRAQALKALVDRGERPKV
jgi:hypothetical protein